MCRSVGEQMNVMIFYFFWLATCWTEGGEREAEEGSDMINYVLLNVVTIKYGFILRKKKGRIAFSLGYWNELWLGLGGLVWLGSNNAILVEILHGLEVTFKVDLDLSDSVFWFDTFKGPRCLSNFSNNGMNAIISTFLNWKGGLWGLAEPRMPCNHGNKWYCNCECCPNRIAGHHRWKCFQWMVRNRWTFF